MQRSLLLLAIFFLPSLVRGAQQSAKPPLVISNVSQQGATVSFDLANVSQKAIRADVIACTVQGGGEQGSAVTVQQTAIYGLGPDVFAAPGFDAGLTHHEQFGNIPRNATGHFNACTLSVDYVLFTNGKSWGPDTRKASLDIRGVISGYNEAIMGLQRKLNGGGADAVLQYIRQFKPIR
jgi:hypothetical protein